MSSKFSIKDLERLSGIKAHTLRIWEQRYEILNPERTSTNIRYYSNEDLKKILNVSLLNNNGFKISNIARLSPNSLLNEASKLFTKYEKESNQIDNLMLSLIEWDEFRFEETVNQSISHFGLENTLEKIVFPFLRQLGNMWQIGVVNPAQEHFMTNLIRQKIIVEIDKINFKMREGSKKYVLFLPNNEFHEMGLLYVHYLCKQKGHQCLYLGQSVPFEDIVNVAELTKPDYLVTILTANFSEEETQEFLKKYDKQVSIPMLISGRLIVSTESKIEMPSSKFKVFKEFLDFKALI